jgi:hypothetical protein
MLEYMRIWLDLPDDVVAQLAEQGQDLSRSALEALAIDSYRMQRLTSPVCAEAPRRLPFGRFDPLRGRNCLATRCGRSWKFESVKLDWMATTILSSGYSSRNELPPTELPECEYVRRP